MDIVRMVKRILLFITVVILTGCGGSSSSNTPVITDPVQPVEPAQPVFTHIGLAEHVIKTLSVIEGMLYAATDKGFYVYADGTEWTLLTPNDWDIREFAAKDSNHIVISYSHRGQDHLSLSTDAGLSWETIRGQFGVPRQSSEPVFKMLYDGSQLYATGYDALAVSNDDGQTWELLAGIWNSLTKGTFMLGKDDIRQELWYGGQGAFENPIVRKYSISDHGYSDITGIEDVLPVPSTVESVVFSSLFPDRVYISGEGGIVSTDDDGENWHPLHTNPDYRFYFDFIVSSDGTTETFYTAGWDKNFETPQSLIFEISRDSGETWQTFEYDDPTLFGGVYSMTAETNEEKDVVFLGLYKGGVMRVDID